MSLIEKILPLERNLFLWLNDCHTPFWDTFMWIYSGKLVWLPLVLALLYAFLYKTKWKEALLLILCCVLVAVLCDQISSSLVKPFFERLRPSNHPDFSDYVKIVNGYRGGRFGFVSSHAANGFGLVTFAALLFRNRFFTIVGLFWVSITCYSRIYLGVHFISDIIGGMLIGIAVGIAVYYLYLFARQRLLKIEKLEVKVPIVTSLGIHIVTYTIVSLILCILIYSYITTNFFFRNS